MLFIFGFSVIGLVPAIGNVSILFDVKKIYPISRDNKNFVKSHPNYIGSKLNYINLDQF